MSDSAERETPDAGGAESTGDATSTGGAPGGGTDDDRQTSSSGPAGSVPDDGGRVAGAKWRKDPSIIISIIALVASIGASVYTGITTGIDRETQAQTRLSALVAQLNQAQQKLAKSTENGRLAASATGSADVRLIAADIAETRRNVDLNNVQKLVLAQSLAAAGIYDQAQPLAAEVEMGSTDFTETLTARQLQGTSLLSLRNLDAGRAKFGAAIAQFAVLPAPVRSNYDLLEVVTEYQWSGAELSAGQCDESVRHLARARSIAQANPTVGPNAASALDRAAATIAKTCRR